ncbi:MAG: FAD synthetase family protein [Tyzzerella sp.]|nr:FAD synthetase family protein [Tyzzerella sp.]
MQYIKGFDAYQDTKNSAITFGKFDGLHQGHNLLIERVEEHQKKDNVNGIVVAFDMSPLFQKLNKKQDFLLTNPEKAEFLKNRIDYFIDCPFDDRIAAIEAEAFIKDIIVGVFHAKYVVVGADFRFGYQKRGDYHMLQEFGEEYNFQVEVFEKKQYEGREISSTYIKEELKKGNTELVNQLLGYDFYLYGKNSLV